jgi:transcriptional regulator with XRE-family HTH domain
MGMTSAINSALFEIRERSREEKKEDLVVIGQNIVRERKAQDMSQKKLAILSGIRSSYMCGIEKGQERVTLYVLRSISRALNTTCSKLLEGY